MTRSIWLCLAEGDEHGPRIRAWTTDPKRAGQLRADGLDMVEYRCLTASAPGEQEPVAWQTLHKPKTPKALSAVGDEAKKSEGGTEGRAAEAMGTAKAALSPVLNAQSVQADGAGTCLADGASVSPSDPTAERREIVARAKGHADRIRWLLSECPGALDGGK